MRGCSFHFSPEMIKLNQWPIQYISVGVGAGAGATNYIFQFFPKNCIKTKKQLGRGERQGTPKSANVNILIQSREVGGTTLHMEMILTLKATRSSRRYQKKIEDAEQSYYTNSTIHGALQYRFGNII